MALYSDEAINQALALVKEIESQSDRGAAIIGAAWVEEELQAAIESAMTSDKLAADRLFRKSGPLSSFSAKIDLARLLGILSTRVATDLHIIRKVRNEFAHSVLDHNSSTLSFSTSCISDRCLAMHVIKHEQLSNPRTAFVRACAILNSEFFTYKLICERTEDRLQIRAHIEDSPG